MKSSPDRCPQRQTRRRSSLVLASTTAILLAVAPHYSDARHLRRNSGSISSNAADMTANVVVEGEGYESVSSNDFHLTDHEEDGFESVGNPMSLGDLVADEKAETDWHRRRMVFHQEQTEGTVEDAKPKEYINDETLAFVDPEDLNHQRHDRACGDDQKLWKFKFLTDNYGYETTWALDLRKDDGSWSPISAGPAGETKYRDNTVYLGATCLTGDTMYRLTISDAYNDGFCCRFGKGSYSYEIDGTVEYDSNSERTFTDKAEHIFFVGLPTPPNDNANDNADGNSAFQGRGTSTCPGSNQSEIRVKLWTDKYAGENMWKLTSLATNQVIQEKGLGSYPNKAGVTDDVSICVPHGQYEWTMTDGVGDGICCGQQGDGRYELYMDGEMMVYGSDFTYGKKVTHKIIAGYDQNRRSEMTSREQQYLNGHNWRRKKYHEEFGATYVPVKYDFSLQADAQNWANELLNDCDTPGIIHEPGVEQGENLAKNTGSAGSKWAQLYPVENICRRWFEREETWPYPNNAHLTQGLWRSARYVGCAESEKTMDNGGTCRIQVCRYARAGNCNMGKYKSNQGDNWKIPMLMDHNPCGPACPPNGCH